MRTILLILWGVCFISAGYAQSSVPEVIDITSLKDLPPDPKTGMINIGDPQRALLVGKLVPDVAFTGKGGTPASLSSYRGKPLLIDLWATWCASCLLSLRSEDAVYREFKDKGLVMISFDQDHDPGKAERFLARNHYEWPNFHDEDRSVETALQGVGLPFALLLDTQGRIVYCGSGNDEEKLRAAVQKVLSPRPEASR